MASDPSIASGQQPHSLDRGPTRSRAIGHPHQRRDAHQDSGYPGVTRPQLLLATWCASVGATWTLELHEIDPDTTLGTLVDWISSGVPTSQPEPDEALAGQLLAERGLRLYPDVDAGPRTRNRRSIGYVSGFRPAARTARGSDGEDATGRTAKFSS